MVLWSDDEEEDLMVPYGTPLPNEDDLRAMEAAGVSRRKLIQVEEGLDRKRSKAGRDLEVRDDKGGPRLHGAFRGGFSAGYYNTVGTKEGWTPGEFKSSRSTRAEAKAFNPQDFMADDELTTLKRKQDELVINEDYGGKLLLKSAAKKQASAVEPDRLGFIFGESGGTSSEESLMEVIGFQVLRKLGWRPGKGISKRKILVPVDSGRSMKEMLVASEDTPLMVLKPRNEKYGVGFDPYENARDFEVFAKQIKDGQPSEGVVSSMFRPNRGQSGRGFGIGALEDYEDDDEDVYKGGDDGSMYYSVLYEEDEVGTLQRPDKKKIKKRRSAMDAYLDKTLRGGIIITNYFPGIESSSIDESTVSSLKLLMQRYPLPVIPIGIELRHKFRTDVDEHLKLATKEHNEEELFNAPPPKDENVKIAADKLAVFVARSGQALEDLARKRNTADPRQAKQFIFLRGGDGADYYYSQLTKEILSIQREKEKRSSSIIMPDARSKLYGEKVSDQVTLNSLHQSTKDMLKEGLHSMFVSSGKLEGSSGKEGTNNASSVNAKPFSNVPEKQKRYERFLMFKEHGGLQPRCPSDMSQGDFIKEEEEFEETAVRFRHGPYEDEAKIPLKYRQTDGGQGVSKPENAELNDSIARRFHTSVADVDNADLDPDVAARAGLFGWRTRIEVDWFPVHLLCKRFGLPDPHTGKVCADHTKESLSDLGCEKLHTAFSGQEKPKSGDAMSQISQLASRMGPSNAEIQPRIETSGQKPGNSPFTDGSIVITRDDAPLAEIYSNFQPENDAGGEENAGASIDIEAKPVDLFTAIFDARESSESESSDEEDHNDDKANRTSEEVYKARQSEPEAIGEASAPVYGVQANTDTSKAAEYAAGARAIADRFIKSFKERNEEKIGPGNKNPVSAATAAATAAAAAAAAAAEEEEEEEEEEGEEESDSESDEDIDKSIAEIKEMYRKRELRNRRKKTKVESKKKDKKKDKTSRKRKKSKKDDKDHSRKKKRNKQ